MKTPKIYKVSYDSYDKEKTFYAVDFDGTLKQEFTSESGSLNGSAITSFKETQEMLLDPIDVLFDPQTTKIFKVHYLKKSTDNSNYNTETKQYKYRIIHKAYVVARDNDEALRKLCIFETDEKDACDVDSVTRVKEIGKPFLKVFV